MCEFVVVVTKKRTKTGLEDLRSYEDDLSWCRWISVWCEQWTEPWTWVGKGVIPIITEGFDFFFLLPLCSQVLLLALLRRFASRHYLVCVHSSSYLFSFDAVVYYSFELSPSWTSCATVGVCVLWDTLS